MPDISKINNVAVADISKLDSVTFAHGQKVNNQDVSLVTDAHTLIATILDISTSDTAVTYATAVHGTGGVVLDTSYDVYEFHFINIHPSTTASILSFQVDVSGSTDYDLPIMSSAFEVEHDESGSSGGPQNRTNRAQDNGTELQQLGEYIGNTGDDNDLSGSGILTLFAPADGTFLKHWISTFSAVGNDVAQTSYHSGYINQGLGSHTAIDKIRFAMTANDPATVQGTIESGTIKMYGIAKS